MNWPNCVLCWTRSDERECNRCSRNASARCRLWSRLRCSTTLIHFQRFHSRGDVGPQRHRGSPTPLIAAAKSVHVYSLAKHFCLRKTVVVRASRGSGNGGRCGRVMTRRIRHMHHSIIPCRQRGARNRSSWHRSCARHFRRRRPRRSGSISLVKDDNGNDGNNEQHGTDNSDRDGNRCGR